MDDGADVERGGARDGPLREVAQHFEGGERQGERSGGRAGASAADDSAKRGRESMALRLDAGAARDAAAQFREEPCVGEKSEFGVPGDGGGLASVLQGAERFDERAVGRGMRVGLGQEKVGEFHQVERLGEAREFGLDGRERLFGLRAGHDVEGVADGDGDAGAVEDVQVAGEFACDLPRAADGEFEFAERRREHDDEAVGVAHRVGAEDKALRLVGARARARRRALEALAVRLHRVRRRRAP